MSELPGRIRTMLDRGHLREGEFSVEKIAHLWKKARRTLPVVRRALVSVRPELSSRLETYGA